MSDRAVFSFKSYLWSLLSLSFILASSSFGITTLKQVQIGKDNQIDLLFDQSVDQNQIQVSYFRDIVQLSIKNVAVYPAKILRVSGQELKKVFAYQYTPKLVRFRITVNDKAELYRKRFKLQSSGKIVKIKIEDRVKARDQIVLTSSQAQKKNQQPEANRKVSVKTDHLSKSEKPALIPLKKEPLAMGKPLASPWNVVPWLAAMLLFFGMLILAIKKLKGSRITNRIIDQSSKLGSLGRVIQAGLSKKEKLIEVVSTHYLGPKKSIAVVRIKERLLVIGITNENINLISELNENDILSNDDEKESMSLNLGDSVASGLGATAAGPAIFSDLLEQKTQSVSTPSLKETEEKSSVQGARERIRRKIEGMKLL